MEKECKFCKKTYPVGNFWKKPSNKDGYSSYCKPCSKSGKLLNSYLKPIDLDGEVWTELFGFEKIYRVSNKGRIKSLGREIIHRGTPTQLPEIIMRQCSTKKGYKTFRTTLNGSTKLLLLHICVAKSFLGNPNEKMDVNHKDGVKSNNNLENLEWVTRSENLKHAYRTGLRLPNENKNPISVIGKYGDGSEISFPSLREAYLNGFVFSSIKRCCDGETSSYKGYVWRYTC